MNRFSNFWIVILSWGVISLVSGILSFYFVSNIPEVVRIQEVVHARQEVSVKLTATKEVHLGKRHFFYLDFAYQGRGHSARIDNSLFKNAKPGQEIKLLHIKKYSNLFLSPNHSGYSEIISYSVLGLLFSFLCIISINKLYNVIK